MKLRVPDYYEEFSCIADRCQDSCCIGWEINIDEDTESYYRSVPGEFGDRLRAHLFETDEGDMSFRLQAKGRCPFLNDKNLCDICINIGEECLSEVCTEYPRFTLPYGDVIQKCLSLSCEEVVRLLFEKEEIVSFVEKEIGGEEEPLEEEEREQIELYESVQKTAIAILQDRSQDIWARVRQFVQYLQRMQSEINGEEAEDLFGIDPKLFFYENYENRRSIFWDMETLDHNWKDMKELLDRTFSEENYTKLLEEYTSSVFFREVDYEQLLVYFTFRYFMNCVYDGNVAVYGKLAVLFFRMVLDQDVALYLERNRDFTSADRLKSVKVFSKEVEHSEENVEAAVEELLFLSIKEIW